MKPIEPPMPDLSTPITHKNPNSPIEVSIKIFLAIAGTILVVLGAVYAYTLLMENQIRPSPSNSVSLLPAKPLVENAVSPAPDVTGANWKTYTNTKFGFTLKYPSSLNTSCKFNSNSCTFDSFVGPGIGPDNFIWITIIPNNPEERTYENSNVYNSSGEDILLNMKVGEEKAIANENTNIEKFFTYKRLPDTIIDEVSAKVFENRQPWEFIKNTIEKRLYIVNDKYLYTIGVYAESSDISLELFDQILSTFKFLDEEQGNIEFPPLYPKVEWIETKEQKQPFMTKNGNFVTKDATITVSKIYKEFPDDIVENFRDYYLQWLGSRGWEETSFAGYLSKGGGTGSFEYTKNGRYFSFGLPMALAKDSDGKYGYRFFVVHD